MAGHYVPLERWESLVNDGQAVQLHDIWALSFRHDIEDDLRVHTIATFVKAGMLKAFLNSHPGEREEDYYVYVGNDHATNPDVTRYRFKIVDRRLSLRHQPRMWAYSNVPEGTEEESLV